MTWLCYIQIYIIMSRVIKGLYCINSIFHWIYISENIFYTFQMYNKYKDLQKDDEGRDSMTQISGYKYFNHMTSRLGVK